MLDLNLDCGMDAAMGRALTALKIEEVVENSVAGIK
jgi:hypothetical protein